MKVLDGTIERRYTLTIDNAPSGARENDMSEIEIIRAALALWRAGNDAGHGEEGEWIMEEGELICEEGTVAVYRCPTGALVGVCDAHGPWAVDLTAAAAAAAEA